MKQYIFLLILLPLFGYAQEGWKSRKLADSFGEVVLASRMIQLNVESEQANFSHPLILTGTKKNEITDFSAYTTDSRGYNPKSMLDIFFKECSFRCTTYEYTFALDKQGKAITSGSEAAEMITKQFQSPEPWINSLLYSKGIGKTSFMKVFIIRYDSIWRKPEATGRKVSVPICFYSFAPNNIDGAWWYFADVKAQPASLSVDSFTALIFDYRTPDHDKIRIGTTVYEITKDTLKVRFLDSLRIQAVSTGTTGPCTVYAVIEETGESIQKEAGVGREMILKPKKQKILATK